MLLLLVLVSPVDAVHREAHALAVEQLHANFPRHTVWLERQVQCIIASTALTSLRHCCQARECSLLSICAATHSEFAHQQVPRACPCGYQCGVLVLYVYICV
jgi:hypothetical protein